MKTKWAHAFKRMRWHVLSAPEYAGLWLRGWITKQQAIRGGALTGATPEQMDLLYKNRGRPMAPVQAFTAWARKAPHPVGEGIPDRPGTFDFQDFKRAIQQSDIRTEYVEPLWAIRYAYPSLFIVNRLVLAGAIQAATAKDWLQKQRMAPEVITALEAYWGSQGVGTAGPYVGRAQTQLWGTVHRTFVARETNVTQARGAMSSLGIPKADQDVILQLWQNERDLVRKQLTPAQLKKAFNKAARNEATGQPWTLDETLAALVAQGYSVEGATDYLNIP
jgi:hypothetical protein